MSEEKTESAVAELMERVKAAVADKIQRGVYTREEVEAVARMELAIREKSHFGLDLEDELAWLHANWDPNGPWAITSHRPVVGRALVAGKKIMRRLLRPFSGLMLARQAEFNSHLTRLVAASLPALRDNLMTLEKKQDQLAENLVLKSQELSKGHDDLFRRLDEARGELQKARNGIDALRLAAAPGKVPAAAPAPPRTAAPAGPALDYLSFEDRHRGPSGDIKDRQRDYLPYFQGAGRVLDAGCGRGEFLELLAEAGLDAYGVEASPQMAALCREKGLRVEVGDINDHLAGLPDDSLGGIFSAQVVEHMTTEAVLDFVRLARAKLAPGGRLVVETLNPGCVAVHTGALYLDLSHTKPIHPEAMRFLLESAPFAGVQLLWRSPFPDELRLKEGRFFEQLQKFEEALLGLVNENFRRLNSLIYGYQDYAVVGTK